MKRLEDARVWVGGGVVAAVLVALAGWFLLVGPQLARAADLRDQTTQAEADSAALQAKVSGLKKQSGQLPTLIAKLTAAQAQLPPTADLSGLATQISAHADVAQVSVSDLSITGAAAVKSAAAAPAAAASPSAGASEGGTAGVSENAPAASPAAGAAAGQLYEVAVTVTTNGSLAHQRAFLDGLSKTGPRAVLIGATQLGAGADSGPGTSAGNGSLDSASTMTSDLTFFVAPQSATAVESLRQQLATANSG